MEWMELEGEILEREPLKLLGWLGLSSAGESCWMREERYRWKRVPCCVGVTTPRCVSCVSVGWCGCEWCEDSVGVRVVCKV